MRRVLLFALSCLVAFCAAAAEPQSARVLFVGDALASSSIPARVAKAAQATGRNVSVKSVARDDQTPELLATGWDIVVLQEEGFDERERFVERVKRWAANVREANAKPALFMMWPRADRLSEFRDTIAAHRAAAEASGAILLPVAESWLRAFGEDRKLKLYADAKSASPLGADLAALTVYLALFPAGPQEFDDAFVRRIAAALDMPPATRDLIFDMATRAIDEPLALGKPRSP
jgi:hypothetical protein